MNTRTNNFWLTAGHLLFLLLAGTGFLVITLKSDVPQSFRDAPFLTPILLSVISYGIIVSIGGLSIFLFKNLLVEIKKNPLPWSTAIFGISAGLVVVFIVPLRQDDGFIWFLFPLLTSLFFALAAYFFSKKTALNNTLGLTTICLIPLMILPALSENSNKPFLRVIQDCGWDLWLLVFLLAVFAFILWFLSNYAGDEHKP